MAQCDLRDDFLAIAENVFKLAAAAFIMDASVTVRTQNSRDEFLLAYYTISFLCYGKADPADLFLGFMMRQIQLGGYMPELEKCIACGKPLRIAKNFSIERGGVYCGKCVGELTSRPVDPLSIEALRRIVPLDLAQLHSIKLPPIVRNELMVILPQYAMYHFEWGGRQLKYVIEMYKQINQ